MQQFAATVCRQIPDSDCGLRCLLLLAAACGLQWRACAAPRRLSLHRGARLSSAGANFVGATDRSFTALLLVAAFYFSVWTFGRTLEFLALGVGLGKLEVPEPDKAAVGRRREPSF